MKTIHPAAIEPVMKNWMDILYFAVTGKGARVHNEDCYGHSCHENIITFVLSDGVGGQAGGAIASKIVVEMIRRHAKSLNRTEMLHGYKLIEREITNQQQRRPEYKNMGATVAELRIDPARQIATWGHFGDSRIYWIRNHEILAVTGDHSVVKNLVTAGLISEHEALTHPKKNILLGAFGMAGDAAPEVLAKPVYLADGDAFLICTDGLWNCVSDHDILELLRTSSSVEEWIRKLESQTQEAVLDDKDNYTAIGVWVTFSDDRTVQISYGH